MNLVVRIRNLKFWDERASDSPSYTLFVVCGMVLIIIIIIISLQQQVYYFYMNNFA